MRWGGLYRGIVIEDDETKDPEYKGQLTGKVKVVVPEIHKFDYEDAANETGDNPERLLQKIVALGGGFWARACFPWGTKDLGDWYIPPKDSGVWISFEAGLPSFPVWMGVWRTPQKRMMLPTGLDKEYIVKRTKWHLIEIKDKTGEEEFHYKNLKNNFELTVNKDGRLTITGPEQLVATFAKAINLTFQDTYTETIAKATNITFSDTFTVTITKAGSLTFQDALTLGVTKTTTFNLSDNFTVNLGSKKMVVNAASAEICGTTALALFSEISTLATELSTFITTIYNLHMHPTAAVGAPSVPTVVGTAPTTPVGTTKLKGA